MKVFSIVAVFMLIVSVGIAAAAEGEVCSSIPALALDALQLTNETKFACTFGQVTIPELYQQGWTLVELFSQMAPNVDDPQNLQTVWTAVIQRP